MLVSICIPAYEYPDFLDRCLASIVNQSYTNFEVIITDDSSHDELLKIVNKFNDSRIFYYKNPIALGSPANWNKCINYAKGDLIKILHHDDWFSNNDSLKKFIEPFKLDSNLFFAFSACTNIFNRTKKNHLVGDTYLKKIQQEPKTIMFLNAIGAPSTTIFKKSVWDKVKYDEKTKWYVDILFYVPTIIEFKKFYYVKESLVNITAESPNQVTHTTSGVIKVKEAFYAFNKLGFFDKKFSFQLTLHFVELFNRYKITSLNEIAPEIATMNCNKQFERILKYSKLPIHYLFFALFRRIYINRSPLKIKC